MHRISLSMAMLFAAACVMGWFGPTARAEQDAQQAGAEQTSQPEQQAAEDPSKKEHHKEAKGGGCPMCAMMHGQMGDAQKKQMKVLMNLQVDPGAPMALLAMKEDLNLTQEQVDQLKQLKEEYRTKAQAILDDNQKQHLASLGDSPFSMKNFGDGHGQSEASAGESTSGVRFPNLDKQRQIDYGKEQAQPAAENPAPEQPQQTENQ